MPFLEEQAQSVKGTAGLHCESDQGAQPLFDTNAREERCTNWPVKVLGKHTWEVHQVPGAVLPSDSHSPWNFKRTLGSRNCHSNPEEGEIFKLWTCW